MPLRINTAAQNGIIDLFGDYFNGGVIEVRTGSQPASANNAASGTLLGTINIPATAFAAPGSGSVAKTGTWSGTAAASGTAGWARMRNSGDTIRLDGTVTTSGGGGQFIINNTSVVSGGDMSVSTGTLTMPAS